jgi:hypothetical protein
MKDNGVEIVCGFIVFLFTLVMTFIGLVNYGRYDDDKAIISALFLAILLGYAAYRSMVGLANQNVDPFNEQTQYDDWRGL